MVFNSAVFAAFFVAVYALYLLAQGRLALQNTILLAASLLFYGWWDWRFLGLLLTSTIIDYLCALVLDRRIEEQAAGDAPPRYRCSAGCRWAILLISLVTNLGILGVFKYFDFFVTSTAGLLDMIGLPLEPRLLNVALPVGISFYTFQTLSYTIDVYRGQMRATRSVLDFALFVTYFPQLVAGPIVRGRDFLPQVSRPRVLQLETVYAGGYLILWGLFKKVVVADNLAMLVGEVFRGTNTSPFGGAVLIGTYAFAIQIYCDFSGYSDMARGVAKMMGFELPLNFRLPYLASTPSEFWRRWHISLSTWIRDYVYVPLGGSRRGPRRTCLNVLLTMALCGLWHGAAWTFVIWGVFHGLLLVAYRAAEPLSRRLAELTSPRCRVAVQTLAAVLFFHLTCLGWLVFRAESVGQAWTMLSALFTAWPWWLLCGACSVKGIGLSMLVVYALPLFIVQMVQHARNDLDVIPRLPAYARGLAYCGMFYGIVWFGLQDAKPFIYFQF